MYSIRLLCLLALLVAVAQSSGKRRRGNVGALFAAGLGGSALGLSYGVLLAGHGRGAKGDHHHIYNYGQGGGGGNEVQVITAGHSPYGSNAYGSNAYGSYLGGYGYGVPYVG